MSRRSDNIDVTAQAGLFTRLLHDRAGNTLAMIAAAVVPILAMVGGGIDMGRSYLSQTRLQQACDAGVLAARKKLGSQVVTTGIVPGNVVTVGNKFFNLNFRNGAYGSANRDFQMTLEENYAISGTASVDVPTTIMTIFGYTNVPLEVECEASLNFSNTDVMMVLDTTGSMNRVNEGDSESRIDVLRGVVKNFHAQLEASKTPGTRIRYGFLPYSTNVNVGLLLNSGWVVDEWTYQGRVQHDTGTTTTGPVFIESWTDVSGTAVTGATNVAATCPADTRTSNEVRYWKDSNGQENWEYLVNGTYYNCSYADGGSVMVTPTIYTDYDFIYSYLNKGNKQVPVYTWRYQPVTQDVTFLKGANDNDPLILGSVDVPMDGNPRDASDLTAWFRGCMEERQTYEIDDYDNVDFSRALDLDLDTVPTPGNPATQWRPMLNEISWVRSIKWSGGSSFSPGAVDYNNDYLMAGWAGLSACPAPAQKLQEMDGTDVSSYVDSLVASGSTYHDIGMIWGGRLLSPTGLFAAENAEQSGKPTSRHLIFLTDGETAPRDLSYGTYGIEPLDQRRWSEASPLTLTETVEKRFTVACNEVKKRNITVWVIGFGTNLSSVMTDCAGPGHSFEAVDAAQLEAVFSKIAASLGDLRISK